MPRNRKTYDVFLSHALDLAPQAKVLARNFGDAGLTVFDISEVRPGYSIAEETWQALAESWAVVVLIRPGTMPPSVAVEIGAASAWQKPLYILTEGKGEYDVPVYISKYEVFKASEVPKVVQLIAAGLNPLTDQQREALIRGYSTIGLPTDRLLREPASIERLRKILWTESSINIPGERIMQELLRLRKRGKLPRVRRRQ
jgi:hypothetical protein